MVRKYGNAPFRVAVVHGGPGAPGDMAPVARELSRSCGVLEPLQTATFVEGQVRELEAVLEEHAGLPAALIGHSWGAWLIFILAARHPASVRKLILVASGPFEESYVSGIMETRLSRLDEGERPRVHALIHALNTPDAQDRDAILAEFGTWMAKTDSYDPMPARDEQEPIPVQGATFDHVWKEAAKLRQTGQLLEFGRHIQCPVVAIHGDYDPHPAEGVERPLAQVLRDFRCVRLQHCGHKPWLERHAQARFYEVLRQELRA